MGAIFEFEVAVIDITPRIWRRFLMACNPTFAELHEAIQVAFGWEDAHLWAFQEQGPERETIAGIPDEAWDEGATPDAWQVSLADFFEQSVGKTRCNYWYDFGDDWMHEVKLNSIAEGPSDFVRRLVAGERACPPEDCGGVFGYERMVEFLETGLDPDGDDAENLAEWLGTWRPDEFDLEKYKIAFDR